jgi:hypothetical protein
LLRGGELVERIFLFLFLFLYRTAPHALPRRASPTGKRKIERKRKRKRKIQAASA